MDASLDEVDPRGHTNLSKLRENGEPGGDEAGSKTLPSHPCSSTHLALALKQSSVGGDDLLGRRVLECHARHLDWTEKRERKKQRKRERRIRG